LRARLGAQGAEFSFTQYHNQTTASSLAHAAGADVGCDSRKESGGRRRESVRQNNNIQGSDPAALKALVAGDIQFFTLMGGILGTIMPAAEVQQVPFAFRSAAARASSDGRSARRVPLVDEMAAKGIHGFRTARSTTAMREITPTTRLSRRPIWPA
jgi:TRAP-type C4-dicarboxylate transport system substrate-binding protein